MAEQTKYTIEEVIALPKGTTPWYDQNQDAYRHIKNTMDTIADISGGGEPGFGSPIDVRGYVQDSSNSTKDYTGVTRPAALQSDYMPAGYAIIFDADRPNTGAATLNLGSGDGAVPIFQYGERNEKVDPVQGAIIGPTLMVFDGSHWVLDKSALPGPPGPEGEDGPAGIGIYVKGSVSTASNLPANGNTVGDAYFTEDDNHIHVWTEEGEWYDRGPTQIEFPLDLSKNNLGDLGDVQLSSEDDGDVLGFNGSFWDAVLIDSHNITDYGIENVDLNDNIVDDRVLDSDGDFNPKGQWNFEQDILVGGKPIQAGQDESGVNKLHMNVTEEDQTIETGINGLSAGPVSILHTITIEPDSVWVIV